MQKPSDELLTLAKAQHSLLRRRQALEYLSERVLARLVGPHGQWHIPLRGIYATFTGELTPVQRRYGAWLYAGNDAQITGAEGCRLHKMKQVPDDGQIKLIIDNERRRQSRGFVVVQRARFMPVRPTIIDDTPVAPLSRCVIDAARDMRDLDSVRAVMMEAVQRRRVPVSHLQTEIELGAIAWSSRPRRVIEEMIRGALSVPEAEMMALMATSTVLPPAHHNCTLLTSDGQFLCVPDAYVKSAGIVGEVQSKEHHLDSDAQDGDMSRRARLGARDVIVFEIRPGRIRLEGAQWLAHIEASYTERTARGVRPRVLLKCRPECPLRAESDVRTGTPPKPH